MTAFFPIAKDELALLASRDARLARAMESIGHIKRELRPGAFHGLIHAICGQQISGSAHKSIWARLTSSFSLDNPGHLADASPEMLRTCGLSARKADYIHNIARQFAEGCLDEKSLACMEEGALRSTLLALPGVGPWTVDMLLIFTFQKKNILSTGDLGIQKGLRMLYGYGRLSPDFYESCFRRYSPLSTIASFYLWELASGKHPPWTDPASSK